MLLDARCKRETPLTDDKVITEWNAMFLSTLTEAAAALENTEWLAAAEAGAEFLVENLRVDGTWMRSWHAKTGAGTHGFGGDYAWLVDMFTRLGEATGKARWRALANDTAEELLEQFWDEETAAVCTTSVNGEQLLVRQKDLFDGAMPSINSAGAHALLRLGLLNDNRTFIDRAERAVRGVSKVLVGHPTAFGNYFAVIDLLVNTPTVTVVVGDHADLVSATQIAYLPRNLLLWGEKDENGNWEGKSDGAYVCQQQTCGPVVSDAEELLRVLQQ